MKASKRKKTVIQTHHIRYPDPLMHEPGWTVTIYKGEHYVLTLLGRRKKVSFGFVAALREWLRQNAGHAVNLQKEVEQAVSVNKVWAEAHRKASK